MRPKSPKMGDNRGIAGRYQGQRAADDVIGPRVRPRDGCSDLIGGDSDKIRGDREYEVGRAHGILCARLSYCQSQLSHLAYLCTRLTYTAVYISVLVGTTY